MKIRTRLTLLFTLLVIFLIMTTGFITWIGIKNNLNENIKSDAKEKAKEVQNVINLLEKDYEEKNAPLKIEDPDIFLYTLYDEGSTLYDGVYLQMTNKKGKIFARSPNLKKQFLPILHDEKTSQLQLTLPNGNSINTYYYSTSVNISGVRAAGLQIALPLTKNEAFLEQLGNYMIIELVIAIIASLLLGQFLAIEALRPVSRLNDDVEKMEVTDFSKRLDISRLSSDEIGKLALTFNRLLERISDSIKIQNRFISDASHELQSPLTAIIGHGELLLKRGEDNPVILKKSGTVIVREAQRLVKLVKDMLYLARSGVQNIEKEEININAMINEIYSDLQPLHHQLTIDVPQQDLYITGEPDAIKQVLINLINNALVAIDENGEINISLKTENTDIKILVKDNGIGISQENLKHLFERFYRVDTSRERNKGGSGLGLSIVYEIIKVNNGTIDIKSEVGSGTTFIISFPLSLKPKQED